MRRRRRSTTSSWSSSSRTRSSGKNSPASFDNISAPKLPYYPHRLCGPAAKTHSKSLRCGYRKKSKIIFLETSFSKKSLSADKRVSISKCGAGGCKSLRLKSADFKRARKRKLPCGVRDASFFNPHFVIRDAALSLWFAGLPTATFAVGSWKQ